MRANQKLRVVLSCGGTGGHITPALAIASIIKNAFTDSAFLFIGSEGGMEESMVEIAGYTIQTVPVKGLPRKVSPALIKAFKQTLKATDRAKKILEDFQPDVVIGTGGYACYPTLSAAASLGIPTAVHESNAIPGLAVKLLARRVDRVWLHFPSAAGSLPRKTRVLTVGNPVRKREERKGGHTPFFGKGRKILSFGGSLGSTAINDAILKLMKATSSRKDVYHLHATGKREYKDFLEKMAEAGLAENEHLRVMPFIVNMPEAMAAADLVICRAGAMTLSELAAAGRPSVLIPSPNVTANHQYKNAKAFEEVGAACLLTESVFLDDQLTATVFELLNDEKKRDSMAQAVKSLSTPDADRLIVEDICRLLKEKGHK